MTGPVFRSLLLVNHFGAVHVVYLLCFLPDEAVFTVKKRLRRHVGPSTADDDEDDCMIVEPKATKKNGTAMPTSARVLSDANGKRKRSADTSLGNDTDKKLRLSKPEDVIMLD